MKSVFASNLKSVEEFIALVEKKRSNNSWDGVGRADMKMDGRQRESRVRVKAGRRSEPLIGDSCGVTAGFAGRSSCRSKEKQKWQQHLQTP